MEIAEEDGRACPSEAHLYAQVHALAQERPHFIELVAAAAGAWRELDDATLRRSLVEQISLAAQRSNASHSVADDCDIETLQSMQLSEQAQSVPLHLDDGRRRNIDSAQGEIEYLHSGSSSRLARPSAPTPSSSQQLDPDTALHHFRQIHEHPVPDYDACNGTRDMAKQHYYSVQDATEDTSPDGSAEIAEPVRIDDLPRLHKQGSAQHSNGNSSSRLADLSMHEQRDFKAPLDRCITAPSNMQR